MNKKEHTPLAVHKALAPFLEKEDNLFVKVGSENDLIRFRGSETDSNFFFHIKGHRKNSSTNKNQIHVTYQPYTEESVEPRDIWIECNSLKGFFENWYSIIKGYSSTKTVFDDPIIEGFEETYYSYFDIIDEEKDKPLDPSIILPLHDHFEEIRLRLNEYKTETNSAKIEEIQEDISQLNEKLTNSGRQEITKRICNIWAKITKLGVKYIKEFVEESRKYVMKEGARRVFQLGQKGLDYIEDLKDILST